MKKSKCSYKSACEPKPMCIPMCEPICEPMPMCNRRCIGTYTSKYRVYENCHYDVCKVCSCCGHEYNESFPECPMCGTPSYTMSMNSDPMMDDPPEFERFDRDFDDFGRRRFGFGIGFGFPFFPFFPFRRFRRFNRF